MRPALGLAAFGVLLAILTVHVLAMDDELMYLSSQSDLFSSSTVEDLGGEIASDELHDYSTKGAGPVPAAAGLALVQVSTPAAAAPAAAPVSAPAAAAPVSAPAAAPVSAPAAAPAAAPVSATPSTTNSTPSTSSTGACSPGMWRHASADGHTGTCIHNPECGNVPTPAPTAAGSGAGSGVGSGAAASAAETTDDGCTTGKCMDATKIYSDGGKCVTGCSAGRIPGDTTRVCAFCPDGKYADHLTKKCGATCPSGKAAGQGTTVAAQKDCTTCPTGKFADHEAHACVTSCPTGKAGGEGHDTNSRKDCTACGPGRYADHRKHACVSEAHDCPGGTTANNQTNDCQPASTHPPTAQPTALPTAALQVNITRVTSAPTSAPTKSNATTVSSATGTPGPAACCAAGSCSCLADGTCVSNCPIAVTETSSSEMHEVDGVEPLTKPITDDDIALLDSQFESHDVTWEW